MTPEQARRKAKALLGTAASGIDPIAPRSEAVGSVVEDYLTAVAKGHRENTIRKNELYLREYWRCLHHLPVIGVKRRDVARGLAEIEQEHSAVVAGRARATLSGFFTWAIAQGYDLPGNPVIGSPRPVTNGSRERVLTEPEIAAIWKACNGSDFSRIVKLLTLTGQRRQEIGGLKWSEIDLGAKLIVLPASRTKNHRAHDVPLSPLAISILPEQVEGRDYLFGRADGFRGYARAKAALDAASGVQGWRTHDIRRTVATLMGEKLGILPHVIEAILNHQSGSKSGVAGIYNRSRYLEDCRAALDRWAAHVAALVGL
jgi:integrase